MAAYGLMVAFTLGARYLPVFTASHRAEVPEIAAVVSAVAARATGA